MSEFSDSYHLKDATAEDAIQLLHRAGLRGFVFPEANGWVTVLPEGDPFYPNQQLIETNQGVLLHFVNGEDHGWGFEVYEGARVAAAYMCEWEGAVQVRQSLDLPELERVLGPVLSSLDSERRREILNPVDHKEVFSAQPAAGLAEAVGLTNYSWISFEYLMRDREFGEESPFGAVFVASSLS
jgi:hypothetical protein